MYVCYYQQLSLQSLSKKENKKLKSHDTVGFHNFKKQNKQKKQQIRVHMSNKANIQFTWSTILEIPVDILNAELTTSAVQKGHA